jgi:hypothetical protein
VQKETGTVGAGYNMPTNLFRTGTLILQATKGQQPTAIAPMTNVVMEQIQAERGKYESPQTGS